MSVLANMSHEQKLALKRDLAERVVKAGLALPSASSPGALAARCDMGLTVERPHTRLIDDALTGLLSRPNGKVMIFTPPQIGKSSRSSRWFPFWWLTMRPADRIQLASYAASLAQTHGSAVREYVRMYGADYGLRLSPTMATKAAWELTAGGGLRSAGVGTGLSGHPADLQIIDDPFAGRAEAESRTMRDKVWHWYSSVWSARRSPGAREAIIMTRWHLDDLAGRLLDRDGRVEEGGEWHVVHLPALALPPDAERGVYEDPLGREPGEPLSHPKIDDGDTAALMAHWTRQRATSTERDWNALYQGTPYSAAGALLTDDDVRDATAERPDVFKRIVVGVDPAGGGRDTVGVVTVGLDPARRAWFLNDQTAKMSAADWPRVVCQVAHDAGADRIVVEKNFGGDMGKQLVAQAWELLAERGEVTGLCPLVAEVTARRAKVLRAEPIAQAVKTGRVMFARGAKLRQLGTEFTMWEPGSTWSPGALDAGVHAVTEVLPASPRGSEISNPARTSRSQTGAGRGIAARRRSA
ncbi:terminase family protein [Gordonia sp. PDNC005]|uniref:terminase large subunit domain-containing protein n=1 Tax=Gordonia sp. PDNC005 TaxID=2811424 RepID=UPI001963425E|nr:terminase family protein [Gordonia sp. PDNC005]QRY62737.1 terminase family protein [Gordonia sp. PDNC005]